MTEPPIKCSEATLRYISELNRLATTLAHEMGLTGGEHSLGAAIYAGTVAGQNALPGHAASAGAISAYVVNRVAGGQKARREH